MTAIDYLRRDLRADAVAGLTVAVMGVPQAMAYAMIAGLPPIYGLYTAIISCTVAAVLGSSRHLVTGPTNALCMVILSLVAHIPGKYPGVSAFEAVLLLTLMTGVIQLAFGALRLGGVIRFVSHSVVIGFTAGAGILIAFNQLKNLLGVDISGAHAERFYEVVGATFLHAHETNPYTLGIGVLTILIVVFAPKLYKRAPGALLGVAITGVLSYLLGWHLVDGAFRVQIVRDIQEIRGTLPAFDLPELIAHPNYELTRELGTGALALAILGLIEAASIARSVATSSGQRLDFNREFIGQGASNAVGSFFQCFAGSGSFTRTAVCYASGGRTRMAAIFSAGWTLLAVLAFGPIANFIPKAALAGILIVTAYSMLDKSRLKYTWRSGYSSRLVFVGTLASTLILPLEYAIFVGVFLSVAFLLRNTGQTDLTHLVERDGGFEEIPYQRAAPSEIVTINMAGVLYFAAAEDLDHKLLSSIRESTRVVVLRMRQLTSVGANAMAMLDHFWRILHERGVTLVVCGIEETLKGVLTRTGLRERIGEQNIFYADNKIFQSTELALARAWSIVERERRREATSDGAPTPELTDAAGITAASILTTRCIRFGDQHQLREAVWLMSSMQKHLKSLDPQPLFLQDREARLAGALTPWQILDAMLGDANPDDHAHADDDAVGALLRRNFARTIDAIADMDPARLSEDTRLARLIEYTVQADIAVVPICHDDGRLKGHVTSDDLLHGLRAALEHPDGERPDA